jgi:hypothetical protein
LQFSEEEVDAVEQIIFAEESAGSSARQKLLKIMIDEGHLCNPDEEK